MVYVLKYFNTTTVINSICSLYNYSMLLKQLLFLNDDV